MAIKTVEVEIEGIKYKLKELSMLDNLEIAKTKGDVKELIRKCLVSPEPTDAFLSETSAKLGEKILAEVNKLNGWGEHFLQGSTAQSGT
mgnify:CR=1 FL=1